MVYFNNIAAYGNYRKMLAICRADNLKQDTQDVLQPPLCDLRVNEDDLRPNDFGLIKVPSVNVGENVR